MSLLASQPVLTSTAGGRRARPSRLPVAALLLALVALPAGATSVGGPLQVSQLLVLLAIAVAVTLRLWHGRTPLPMPSPLLWAVGLLGVVLLSTATSVSPAVSFRQVFVLTIGIGLCATVVAACSDLQRWLTVLRGLLLGGVLVCVPAVFSARSLDSRYGGSVVNDRPIGVFAQPNELGAFSMVIVLVALGLLLSRRRGWDRSLALLALTSSGAALAVSLSRGAWIGTVFGVLGLLLWVPRSRRPILGVGTAVVLLVAVLAVVTPSLTPVRVVVERVASLGGESNPYDDRPRIWDEAIREAQTYPVLGVGPGAFEQASTRVSSGARTVGAEHAHNVLLTATAETGFLGLTMLLGLTLGCGLYVWRALRLARGPVLPMLAGVAGAMFAFVGQGLFDVPFKNALVAQTLWVTLGLALAGAQLVRRGTLPLGAVPAPRAPVD